MELYPIWKKGFGPDCYVIIESLPIPSMCAEFDPGPPEDHPYPEYWDATLQVAIVDIHEGKCTEVKKSSQLRELYRFVEGRSERIQFWRTMKYLEYCENSDD